MGCYAILLMGEQFSRPTHAHLDFVEDEEKIFFLAKGFHLFQIILVRTNDPTFSLYRLNKNSAHRSRSAKTNIASSFLLSPILLIIRYLIILEIYPGKGLPGYIR